MQIKPHDRTSTLQMWRNGAGWASNSMAEQATINAIAETSTMVRRLSAQQSRLPIALERPRQLARGVHSRNGPPASAMRRQHSMGYKRKPRPAPMIQGLSLAEAWTAPPAAWTWVPMNTFLTSRFRK